MTPPTTVEMQIFTAACGFLASASFMRFVLKPARKPRGDRSESEKAGRPRR